MKKAFTILELLVASLLLGMLVSILTMMFNQSSIAWRTGVAGVMDLDEVRDNIAEVRDEADNVYLWDGDVRRITGVWDSDGNIRKRAWNVEDEDDAQSDAGYLKGKSNFGVNPKLNDIKTVAVGTANSGKSAKTYTVNVKSAGPDREFDTWDDIWSYPDEIN